MSEKQKFAVGMIVQLPGLLKGSYAITYDAGNGKWGVFGDLSQAFQGQFIVHESLIGSVVGSVQDRARKGMFV